MEYKYQVALSFAGEDREFVNKVAELLKENKISVFYDLFEQVDLLGKDLGVHFDYIYRRQAQYFIPFISKNYEKKFGLITRLEQPLQELLRIKKNISFLFVLTTQSFLEFVQLLGI